jgi:hypothetical protein
MDAPPWLARSRLLHARLLHRAGGLRDAARGEAENAHAAASALGMTKVAGDAAA